MNKKIILILGTIAILVVGLLFGIGKLINFKDKEHETIENIDIVYNKGNKYYIIKGDYQGEYDYQTLSFDNQDVKYEELKNNANLFNTTQLLSYYEYNDFCEKWNLTKKYNDINKKYMVIAYTSFERPITKVRLANVIKKEGTVTIYMWEKRDSITADMTAYFIAIPVDEKTYQKEIKIAYTAEEYENIVKYESTSNRTDMTFDKPILYIYPKEETKVNVKILNDSLITTSYPRYNKEWNVIAKPDGTLKDLETNRSYYGLYYEAKNHYTTIQNEGFVVEGNKSIEFLEEKLEILGLNEREIDEFIIYWLPKLERSNYNYIRFETEEEINNYVPLQVTPRPDTTIRILMDFKPLTQKIEVKEQELTPKKRNGYTIVEWGGSEIK